MLGQVQNAASDAVENTIQASVATNRYTDRLADTDHRPRPSQPPLFDEQHSNRVHLPNMGAEAYLSRTQQGNIGSESWTGFTNQGSLNQNQPAQTPSSHRQRFAASNLSEQHMIPPVQTNVNPLGTPYASLKATPARSPLKNIGHNANGFAGYGMSAGLKSSNPTGNMTADFGKPVARPRGKCETFLLGNEVTSISVAPRPGTAMPLENSTILRGDQPVGNIFRRGNGYY
ncbi:hypothetical protein PVAG01_00834 [Phlyctema vagabunda]|uniref:Uncharacterized protein n=1 Tax=Phlyctema vagabunda TaxID=108571 RepID=A0ABR4PVQ5_9HELO